MIRHYEHNFSFFPKKSIASIICTFCYVVLQKKIVIYWPCDQFFCHEIRVTGKVNEQNIFFGCLFSHSWDLGPTESDLRFFLQNLTHVPNCSVTQDCDRAFNFKLVRKFCSFNSWPFYIHLSLPILCRTVIQREFIMNLPWISNRVVFSPSVSNVVTEGVKTRNQTRSKRLKFRL